MLIYRDPLPYAPKGNVGDQYRGKQMGTVPAKLGRLPKTYFEKELKCLFQDLPYVDRVMYAQLQPEKPAKGFHTSDYSRRDEFTMTFRTDQYRDLLKVGAFAPYSTLTGILRNSVLASEAALSSCLEVGDPQCACSCILDRR